MATARLPRHLAAALAWSEAVKARYSSEAGRRAGQRREGDALALDLRVLRLRPFRAGSRASTAPQPKLLVVEHRTVERIIEERLRWAAEGAGVRPEIRSPAPLSPGSIAMAAPVARASATAVPTGSPGRVQMPSGPRLGTSVMADAPHEAAGSSRMSRTLATGAPFRPLLRTDGPRRFESAPEAAKPARPVLRGVRLERARSHQTAPPLAYRQPGADAMPSVPRPSTGASATRISTWSRPGGVRVPSGNWLGRFVIVSAPHEGVASVSRKLATGAPFRPLLRSDHAPSRATEVSFPSSGAGAMSSERMPYLPAVEGASATETLPHIELAPALSRARSRASAVRMATSPELSPALARGAPWEAAGRVRRGESPPEGAAAALPLLRAVPAEGVASYPLETLRPAPRAAARAPERMPYLRRAEKVLDVSRVEETVRRKVEERVEKTLTERVERVVARELSPDSPHARRLGERIYAGLYESLLLERERLGWGA